MQKTAIMLTIPIFESYKKKYENLLESLKLLFPLKQNDSPFSFCQYLSRMDLFWTTFFALGSVRYLFLLMCVMYTKDKRAIWEMKVT